MLSHAGSKPLCGTCSVQLLELFVSGFVAPTRRALPRARPRAAVPALVRPYHATRRLRQVEAPTQQQHGDDASENFLPLDQQRELKARQARQLYGDTLPENHLSVEEYQVYERLYGEPFVTKPEDEKLLQPLQEEMEETLDEHGAEHNALLQENKEGELEEIEYEESVSADEVDPEQELEVMMQQEGESDEQFQQRRDIYTEVTRAQSFRHMDDQEAMLQDLAFARSEVKRQMDEDAAKLRARSEDAVEWSPDVANEDIQPFEASMDEEEAEGDYHREHPLTTAGRFATWPRTVQMPPSSFTEPVQSHLAKHAKYEHLIDAANQKFGGRMLPDSNATPPTAGRHFHQKPIPLEASQFSMSPLDANLFMTTIMPGAYASIMSVLVELRKRLGSSWLEGLLKRPGGPRVLDAGAGGAGVIAWREVLSAEWDRMHAESGRYAQDEMNMGTSTVLAGSSVLQASISQFLRDTSFIPRMPDFNRPLHMPAERENGAAPRKQYDMIIAPYTLWSIEEDYMRKTQVQNLWSLLDPKGGVLIIMEKGIPRGFEVVAGAREVLLRHHIKNSQPDAQEQLTAMIDNKHTQMEDGMIIAPCPNHKQCPMYKLPGEAVGRKDFCHFSQRYERPPFLQRILGSKFHNFEDIQFSYVAVQRGRDLRKEQTFAQNESATIAAAAGFEEDPDQARMLNLPRILMPPLKRTGHVTMDMCTPHGTLERWTTPKSFSKQAYRDARKARWGDIWALGAKTRVSKPARIGRPKDEQKKQVIDVDSGEAMDSTGIKPRKKVSKAKDRGRKARIGRQPKNAKQVMLAGASELE